MEADWDEVTRIPFPPPGIHALSTPVSVLAFDSDQELLWTGNEHGRVTSFYGADLQRYTSYRGHISAEGPVRQLLFNSQGVISIASHSVHMSSRKGMAIWNITHEKMTDLRCMTYTSRGTSEILVAGLQDVMFTIDVDKGRITKEIATESQYTLMKHSRYICAATSSGAVDLLESKTFAVVKTWKAHAAGINDMDAQNNFLVTCGFSPRQSSAFMLDPLANVFDLKTMMPLPPIPFHAGAAYVRMHPRMSTTGIVASQNGQLQVVDLMNPNTVNLRQAIVTSYLTNLELAPSGEALALADADCTIQLWGSPSKVHFATLGNPVEFADVPNDAPPVIGWSTSTPLSSIGLPYYRETLLSAWPSHQIYEIGAPPAKIDPEVLASLTLTEFGGYGVNHGKRRRNQIEGSRATDKESIPLMAPKFLSEKAREPESEQQDGGRRASDVVEALGSVALGTSGIKAEIPVMYRNVEIKYSKFGVDDFDFEFYNKTSYSGLEIHIANSYSNSLLQLYRFTPLLRNLALHHAATSCLSETCLLCEMGYLFNVLELARGQNCQASNFLKTFSSLPQAAAMGLLEEESPDDSLPAMVQVLNRFLLERISSDDRQMSPQSGTLERTLAMAARTAIRCVNCHSETVRPGGTFVNELAYPSAPSFVPKGPHHISRPPIAPPPPQTFSQILKSSVERATQTRGWCDKCRRYQSLATRKTVQAIPDVFLLNAAINGHEEAKRYWSYPGWLPSKIGLIVNPSDGQFFCYEGEDLRLHEQRGRHEIKVYELVGIVAEVASGAGQASHLVSMIDVSISTPSSSNTTGTDDAPSPPMPNWHLFNDFLVKPITSTEALTFHATTWKSPCILAFQTVTAHGIVDSSWRTNLESSLLYSDYCLPTPTVSSHPKPFTPLSPTTEAPTAGTIVAIDSEFISLHREEISLHLDGTRETIRPARLGLARVSVLRGAGHLSSLPFLDDYIATTSPIVDYLTAFSGIREGDLDPSRSTRHLVPLKVAYKKLWLLVNLGCIFVGHGLGKDFRTINIRVPKHQVIDTVELFFIKSRQRKLSLRFLAWVVLGEEIQNQVVEDESRTASSLNPASSSSGGGHDSIEDARTALRLYRKYEEFVDAGVFERVLQDIYKKGHAVGFKVPTKQPIPQPALINSTNGGGPFATSGRVTPTQADDLPGAKGNGPRTPGPAGGRPNLDAAAASRPSSTWTPGKGKGGYFSERAG